MPMLVLDDSDVARLCTAELAVASAREALADAAAGILQGPPRLVAPTGAGDFVFTVGGRPDGPSGFRAYGSWRSDGDQLVAVWDAGGRLTGLVTGTLLGALRTGGLGGAAVDALARPDADVLAVLGSGRMAWAQVWAAVAVRTLREVRVWSPDADHRISFTSRVRDELGVAAQAAPDARTAVEGAGIVIVSTVATSPVLATDWLAPGCHVNSTGPKGAGASELDPELAERAALVVSDSPAQIEANPDGWFTSREAMPLGEVVAGLRPGRRTPGELTLYVSTGLAGSEVVLADRLLRRVR
jgi:alanine dehydrogenase